MSIRVPSGLPADPTTGPPCPQCLVVLSAFCPLSGPRRDIGRPLEVRSWGLQRPPPVGVAPERDPGVSRAASRAGNPPLSASFWSLYPALPEFLRSSFPDLQCHFLGGADRAATVGLTIYLRELCPLGWVTVWSASPRRSLAGFLLSLSPCARPGWQRPGEILVTLARSGDHHLQLQRLHLLLFLTLSLICTSCWLSACTCL